MPSSKGTIRAQDLVRLASGASLSVSGSLFGRAAGFAAQVLVARSLGPATFGLYAVGWSLFRTLGVIVTLGLPNGVIHFGSRSGLSGPEKRPTVHRALLLSFASGLVAGLALYAMSTWLAGVVFQKPELATSVRGFALALPLLSALQVATAATRVSQRMQFSVVAEDIGQPAVNLLLLVLLMGSLTLRSAVLVAGASFACGLAIAVLFVVRMYPPVPGAERQRGIPTSELLRFSLPTAVAGALTASLIWMDRVFVGYFRPASEVGVYHAASQMSLVFPIVLTGFSAILAPMFASLYRNETEGRLQELYRVSTKWVLYIVLPLLAVILVMPEHLLSAVFGSEYLAGSRPLLILSGGQFVNAATGSVGFLLIMTGGQWKWLRLSGLATLVHAVASVVLIPRWGLEGAATASASSFALLYVSGLLTARRDLGIWPYDRRFYKPLLAGLGAIAGVLVVRSLSLASVFVSIGAGFGAACVGVVVILALLGGDSEDRALMAHLIRRVGAQKR